MLIWLIFRAFSVLGKKKHRYQVRQMGRTPALPLAGCVTARIHRRHGDNPPAHLGLRMEGGWLPKGPALPSSSPPSRRCSRTQARWLCTLQGPRVAWLAPPTPAVATSVRGGNLCVSLGSARQPQWFLTVPSSNSPGYSFYVTA